MTMAVGHPPGKSVSSRPRDGQDAEPEVLLELYCSSRQWQGPQVILHPAHQAGIPRRGT